MRFIDEVRLEAVQQIGQRRWFAQNGARLVAVIRERLGNTYSREDLISQGGHLRQLLAIGDSGDTNRTTSTANRSRSVVGYGWEGLVAAYLNLCLVGTNAVALLTKEIPPTIKEAFGLNFRGSPIGSSSDLDLAILINSHLPETIVSPGSLALTRFHTLIAEHFSTTSVINCAAKSNWNDLITTPVYANILYQAARDGGRLGSNIVVGSAEYNLSGPAHVHSVFFTAPTNRRADNYKQHQVAVKRLRTMTLGYYWGQPSADHCLSLGEFFHHAGQQMGEDVFPALGPLTSANESCIDQMLEHLKNA